MIRDTNFFGIRAMSFIKEIGDDNPPEKETLNKNESLLKSLQILKYAN